MDGLSRCVFGVALVEGALVDLFVVAALGFGVTGVRHPVPVGTRVVVAKGSLIDHPVALAEKRLIVHPGKLAQVVRLRVAVVVVPLKHRVKFCHLLIISNLVSLVTHEYHSRLKDL